MEDGADNTKHSDQRDATGVRTENANVKTNS